MRLLHTNTNFLFIQKIRKYLIKVPFGCGIFFDLFLLSYSLNCILNFKWALQKFYVIVICVDQWLFKLKILTSVTPWILYPRVLDKIA